MDQVLFVKHKPALALYIEYSARGHIRQIHSQARPLPSSVPALPIQRKEYDRLIQTHDLKRAQTLVTKDIHERQRLAGQRYRQRIAKFRNRIGKPLQPLDRGYPAPDSDVETVQRFAEKINPATGKPYLGIEIAIEVGRSASFVSRVLCGKRRAN